MSILTVEGLTHLYGDKTILKSVQFQLSKTDHVGLIGDNGAGKSTLIEILCGELLPDAGRVEWLPGTRIGHLQQHLSMMPGTTLRNQLRTAFAHLYAKEAEMLSLAEQMGASSDELLARQLRRFAELQEQIDREGLYEVDARIERIAAGLGLTELGMESNVNELSGGQRTKVLLAQLLLEMPQVLLLDEPTNYLDTAHVDWLTSYLMDYPHAFVVVSHDTDFINRIAGIILHLEHQTITRYPGNIDAFTAAYELRKNQMQFAYQQQQEEIRKLETYIQKNKARASTAKQAKSREKKLGRIDRINPPSAQPRPRFSFHAPVTPTGTVMEATNLLIGYENPLFHPLTIQLKRGAKVAVTGFNGVGKTTLLKSILGVVPWLAGDVAFGDRVLPAYFEQEPASSTDVSAMESVWLDHPQLTQKEVREALAKSGLRGEKVLQPMNTLSGGEQAKVRLCKLMLAHGNWLVLDEPTNHLDAVAKESLREALMQFEGTVLVVTHEPEFYRGWVTEVWNVESWVHSG